MAKVGCVCIEVVYIIFFGQNASNNDSKPRKLYLPWLLGQCDLQLISLPFVAEQAKEKCRV